MPAACAAGLFLYINAKLKWIKMVLSTITFTFLHNVRTLKIFKGIIVVIFMNDFFS